MKCLRSCWKQIRPLYASTILIRFCEPLQLNFEILWLGQIKFNNIKILKYLNYSISRYSTKSLWQIYIFYSSKDLEIYLAFVLKAKVREISVTIDDYLLHKMFIFFLLCVLGYIWKLVALCKIFLLEIASWQIIV